MDGPASPSPTSEPTSSSGVRTDDFADLHTAVGRRLERYDHRYTSGRRQLVEALADAARPVTLPQLVTADNALPQSSAYRNLEVLERCGIISRITGTADHAHFELAEPLVDHHHHLVCLTCGGVEDVHLDGKLEELVDGELSRAAAAAGFTPSHHQLDLHGYCHRCEPDG